jgi:hypothetical protein
MDGWMDGWMKWKPQIVHQVKVLFSPPQIKEQKIVDSILVVTGINTWKDRHVSKPIKRDERLM